MPIGKRTFQSAGQISQHLIPGGYSRIDSVKGAAGLASANNGVIMGKSKGGKPQTLLQFNTRAEAVNALRGGDLMEAVRLAFNPGNDYVPQTIYAMRVNTAAAGTLSLYETPPATNLMITVTSLDYGLWVNQIQLTLASASPSGKKVTISYQSDEDEVFDDIVRQSFTIEYTDAACSMTIVNKSSAKTLTTTAGYFNSNPITLTDFDTMGEMAAFINAQTDYTCTVIAGQENASPIELDAVSGLDIYTTAKTVMSDMQAIIDTINAGSARVKAVAANADVDRAVPGNVILFITGGTEGTYDVAQWTSALVVLEAENIQFISTPDDAVVLTGLPAQLKDHCTAMSAVTGRKERQFLIGAPWKAAAIATEIAAAQAIAVTSNSKYGVYVFNGGTQYDVNGVLQNRGGCFAACMLMGMACTTAINMPLTFKTLNLIELEWALSTSQLEQLTGKGVCPINYNTNGNPHCVRQIQTYQTDDLKWNEFSMAKEMLFASRDLRAYIESLFAGKPGTSLSGGVLKGTVEARLDMYKELGIFITNPDTGLAWWNVIISISGDTILIDYDAYVTAPVNFMFITNHMHEMVTL